MEASPRDVATAWVRSVMEEGDLAGAWALTDPTFRLVLAQEWVWAERKAPPVAAHDREELAAALASCPPTHPLWGAFAREQVATWQAAWTGFSTRSWGVVGPGEPVRVDLEVVTFAERGAPRRPRYTKRLAVRLADTGWQVAGLTGERLFRPGWPPALEPAE